MRNSVIPVGARERGSAGGGVIHPEAPARPGPSRDLKGPGSRSDPPSPHLRTLASGSALAVKVEYGRLRVSSGLSHRLQGVFKVGLF